MFNEFLLCRHCGLLSIKSDCSFKMDPIKLQTVRPFVMDSVRLCETGIHPQDNDEVEDYLTKKVEDLIEKAKEENESDKQPLVRLKVCCLFAKQTWEKGRKKNSPWRDLNSRPLVYKTSALTTELQRQAFFCGKFITICISRWITKEVTALSAWQGLVKSFWRKWPTQRIYSRGIANVANKVRACTCHMEDR